MEIINTVLVIYAALCLRFTVMLTGAQTIRIHKYMNEFNRGADVTLICYWPININISNCQWYFAQNGGEERSLTNGTRYTWSCSQESSNSYWLQIKLLFKNVTLDDSGIYTCEATTASGADRKEMLLTVVAKPDITVHKTNYTAVSGTNVTLECMVNDNGEIIISIEWEYKVNQYWTRARRSEKYFWTVQMPSLIISDIQTSDSKFYRCLASNRIGTAEGPAIFLNVQSRPVVIVPQTQFFITAGEDIVLNCSVNGSFWPILDVMWYRRYPISLLPLTNEVKYEWSRLGPDASIRIQQANENDAGIYVCEGTTAVGSSKGKDIELKVGYKPTVTVNEYNYSIGEGNNLTLHCSIEGHGSTVKSVKWLKESSFQFKYLQPTTRVFWNISSPSIKINIVQFDDAGRYTCIGTTDFGTTSSSQISVQIFSKPIIRISVYEYKPINGTTAVLELRIDDRMQTSLSVQWEKYKEENQQWFPLENNSRLLWTFAEPSLRIATALVEDDGKYRVVAKTAYHEVRSSPITVIIYVPVKIKELETRPVFISQGDTVEIRCLVDGRPEPKVTWKLANGTTVVASSFKNVQENILILESVTDLNEGNYTCIAHNSFSMDESLICLTVSDLLLSNPPNEDLTGNPLDKYVIPGVSVSICVALIALIVAIILIRRKRQKGHRDKPNLEIRSTNEQKQPSPSDNIQSGNNHSKFYVHLSGDVTYAQVIRKSSKVIDVNKSIMDTSIPQSDKHVDGNNSVRDTDASQVENKTEELNYIELEFSSNAQDENSSLGIRGFPSDTTYTEVVVFTR